MKRVGGSSIPEQPEEIKLEIEGLRTEIENAGNSLVDDLEAFLERTKDSEEPSERAEARIVLQRLKSFKLQPGATETPAGSTATTSLGPAPASPSASKQESVMQKGISWLRRGVENAREDGSPKSSNPETKA